MAILRRAPAVALLLLTTLPALVGVAVADPAQDARPLFRFVDDRLDSSSGLALSPDGSLTYTMQDAGKATEVFAVDLTGQTRATLQLSGVHNEDWEDMSRGVDEAGKPALFVSDMGDAYFTRRRAGLPARDTYSILRFSEPQILLDKPAATMPVQGLVAFPVVYADHASRNSESLAVRPRTNQVFVVDKVAETAGAAGVWAAPPLVAGATNVLTQIAQVPVAQVTAAAFSPDGTTFAVRDYRYAYIWRNVGADLAVALRSQPTILTLPPQPQGEGMAFEPDGKNLRISSEGKGSLVWELPLDPGRAEQRSAATSGSVNDGAGSHTGHSGALWVLGVAGLGVAALAVAESRATARHKRSISESA